MSSASSCMRCAASAVVLIGLAAACQRGEPSSLAFPAPPATAAESVSYDDFAGSDACARCHTSEHTQWLRSTHGRAGQSPPGDLVLRPFNGETIRFRDAAVEARLVNGQHQFVVRWADRADVYPVLGVVGAAHMAGGGTQGFVWRHADGSIRLLPFELSGKDGAWFCATSPRIDRGWRRITPDLSITDCNDWPPNRMFGSSQRYATCQECHGSQIENTRFRSLSINCESCHGPARRHAEGARMPSLATLETNASISVCMRCHALKSPTAAGYLPGRDFDRYYSLKLSLMGEPQFPDGRTRTFAYQQGHLYSDCYLAAGMTCIDCHEPHTQSYQTIQRVPIDGRLNDAQCTDCHPSKANRIEAHTRHKAGSAGSRCVACHMPYLPESAVGEDIHYTRSDHTISVPRPALDQKLGAMNACRTCHQQSSNQQLDAQLQQMWGELKPLRPVVAALMDQPGRSELEQLIMDGDTLHAFAYFDALLRYLDLLEPDAASIGGRIERKLWQLAQSRDADLAAVALAVLHTDAGQRARVRQRLVQAVQQMQARDFLVRRRWTLALAHQGDRRKSAVFYHKALELEPNHAGYLHALGLLRLDTGDAQGAIEALARATEAEPGNSLAWTNYGRARQAFGDQAGAEAAFRRATTANPADGAAFFFLGNALMQANRRSEALDAYTRAAELDPSLAAAHFNRARVLLLEQRDREAVGALRRGLAFDPQNQEAREVLLQLESGR